MSDLKSDELESKIAFLERHIEEQDKVILKMEQRLDRVFEELENLRSSLQGAESPTSNPADEKPPHY